MDDGEPEQTKTIGSTDRIPADKLAVSPNDRYHTRHVIGSGGMKIVVKSEDLNVGRNIAMAISKDSSEQKQLRFLEEARITASLEHPNIVPVHDIGRSKSGVPYFTMKLVHGVTLAKILDSLRNGDPVMQKRFPLHVRLDIFLKICDAIAFAHSRGVIHLDLKPDNIQVGEYGEVLVLDWGIARRLNDTPEPDASATTTNCGRAAGVTLDGIIRGTPEYMAPEQAAGKNSSRNRLTDIYSLGAILYSILTLHPPFKGGTMEETLQDVLDGRIIPPRDGNGDRIPLPLEFIILRAMSRNPARRYQSVQALKDDVVAYQSGFATEAENAGMFTRFLLWLKRNKIRIYVISSLVLTVIIILAFLAIHLYTRTLSEQVYGRSEQARIAAERAFSGLETRIRRENYREWNLKFEDTFRDSYIHDRWKLLLNRSHELSRNQALRFVKESQNGARIFAQAYNVDLFFREQLLSTDLRMLTEFSIVEQSPGAAVQMTLNNTGFSDGFIFTLTPRQNSYVSLHRGHNEETLAEARVDNPPSGEAWKIDLIITTGPRETCLKMSVQGKEVLTYTEPRRLSALPDRTTACAFSLFKCTLDMRSVKLMTLGTSIKADILDIAERQLRKGNFAAAAELFTEAEESATSPERRKRSADGLRMARLFSEYRSRIPQWEELLRRSWKDATIRLYLEDGGFHLFASGESVRDLSVLREIPVSGLTLVNARPLDFAPIRNSRLKMLILQECRIPDPAPLADLPLAALILDRTPLVNTDFLRTMRLRRLTLRGCGIDSIQALTGMKPEALDISGNRIADLSPLAGMPLKTLRASFNQISSIVPLRSMPLKKLDLSCNRIKDIYALNGLPVTDLNLSGNRITDLSALSEMPLRKLDLSCNRIESLTPLSGAAELNMLFLSQNNVSSLRPLRELKQLQHLDAGYNRISSLEPLEHHSALQELSVPGNRITGLTPLENLPNLRFLNCSGNPIPELDPLNKLKLDHLIVSGSAVTSFGTMFQKPPRELFLFHEAGMPPDTVEQLRSRITPGPATERLSRHLRILETFRKQNGPELRSMAAEINGKYYSLIPVMMTHSEARRAAAALGAYLPSWNSQREQAELYRSLKIPCWTGITYRDGQLFREDGTLYRSGLYSLPEGINGCFLDRRRREKGIIVNLNPALKLPLVLEWK